MSRFYSTNLIFSVRWRTLSVVDCCFNMSIFQLILFSYLNFLPSFADVRDSDSFKLTVEVDNIRHTEGQILRISITNKDLFLSEKKPLEYAIVEVRESKISHSFSLPKGEYAISVYHDLNGNDKLDKNFFGAPVEPYGFSRNFKPVMRAPKFEEVQIILGADRKINISLIQP